MITPEDLAEVPLFAAISPALRARIAARSAEIRVGAGAWFAHEGEAPYLWTVLDGEVERVRNVAGRDVQITTFDPGEYFGEVPIIMGSESFASMRALKPSRLMRTDPPDFHLLVTESSEAAEMIAATLSRRVKFIGEAYSSWNMMQALIVGDRTDVACHGTRDFLARNQIAFDWLDPADPADRELIPAVARDAKPGPVVVLADGTMLRGPENRELACALGLAVDPAADAYDVVIVGGGPAGLAAAVYGGSEGLHALMVEREAPGGQAGTSSRIENYLGFPAGISGGDLASRALRQAKRFGTEILVTRWVCTVAPDGAGYLVTLDGGDTVRTRTIALATGVTWRQLEAEGAEAFVGRGIYYGAARTEAVTVRGKDVILVGGGNSAGQAAVFFAAYARSVTILVRGDGLARTMSRYLIDQLATLPYVTVEPRTTVVRALGAGHLERIVTRGADGAEREREIDAMFVFIGADAQTTWLPDGLERDARGYVRTGRDLETWTLERQPFPLETSMPGVFAAGDVRSGSVKRVAAGVGEGSMLIAYIHQYLEARAEPVVR